MDYLKSVNKLVWIRYVLVLGNTHDENDLHKWAKYVSGSENIERVDILPFHQMAIHKWEKLDKEYLLKEVLPTTTDQIKHAETIFKSYGVKI